MNITKLAGISLPEIDRMNQQMRAVAGIPGLTEKFAAIDKASAAMERAAGLNLGAQSALQQVAEETRRLEETLGTSAAQMKRVIDGSASYAMTDAINNITNASRLWEDQMAQTIGHSTKLEEIARGFGLGSAIQEALESMRPPREFASILEQLEGRSRLFGEYVLDDEYVGDNDEPGVIEPVEPEFVVPESVEKRLVEVNYLPVKLLRDLFRNPDLMRDISSRQFEYVVASLLDQRGFEKTQVTSRSNDGGRDIIAVRRVGGIPLLFAFECKRYGPDNQVGPGIMRSLLGTVQHRVTQANMGVLVTTSYFTPGAKKFMLSETMVDGNDFDDLVGWIKAIRARH